MNRPSHLTITDRAKPPAESHIQPAAAAIEQDAAEEVDDEESAKPPIEPVTRAGDLWLIDKHRLICGDCRDEATIGQLLDGRQANVAITSPPYASQREYDTTSGFTPIPPADYSTWFRAVAPNIQSVLSPDGSYFLNIKEHAENGEHSLYVKDLVLAHKRQWGWRFVDEFCWRNTSNGVPGGWPNRFKNAWEAVFHFTRSERIKFRPEAVSHESEDVVVYSPDNPKAPSGSGLLGCGADKIAGLARPSNVIEVKAEGGQGEHSAPFPRALVEFFVNAFSDRGDLVFDPFGCCDKFERSARGQKAGLALITVVSGLPRSGTSLIMQMLASAGIPIQQDGIRKADQSNARGYFEWERIKQLPREPALIAACEGTAGELRFPIVRSLCLPASGA